MLLGGGGAGGGPVDVLAGEGLLGGELLDRGFVEWRVLEGVVSALCPLAGWVDDDVRAPVVDDWLCELVVELVEVFVAVVFDFVVFVRIGQAENGAVVVSVAPDPDVVAPPMTSCVTSVVAWL